MIQARVDKIRDDFQNKKVIYYINMVTNNGKC